MTNPAYIEWIWLSKAGTADKLVHPDDVASHLALGWQIKSPQSKISVEPSVKSVSSATKEKKRRKARKG